MRNLFILSTAFAALTSTYASAIDCCALKYDIYGEVLYMQPNGNDQYYGVEAIALDPDIAVPAVSPNWNTFDIDPNYHAGFEIGTKVFNAENDTTLNLSWERYHAQDSASFSAPNEEGFMVGPFFDIGPNSQSYKNAKGKAVYHFDEVNLSFGKALCFTEDFHAHLYGGISYAHIKQTINGYFSNADETIARSVFSPSTFDGAGPQCGAHYDYQFCGNFFFTGKTVLSCFLGEMKTHTTFKSYTPELALLDIAEPNTQKTFIKNRTQIVPSFEQKLGVAYLWACNNWDVNFEVGYRCQVYFNAVRTVNMTAPQVLPAGAPFSPEVGVYAVGFQKELNNFILSGPYLTINVGF